MPALRNRVLAGLLVATTAVHLGAHLTSAGRVADVTQWFLMPLLAAWVAMEVRAPRDRLVRLVLAGLVASWLGDTAPHLAPSGSRFLVMVAFFLCAQVCYVAAFWPFRAQSVLGLLRAGGRRAGTIGTLAYLVALVALIAACAPGTGSLLVPTVVYGVCLVSMAALATGVNRRVAIGAAIFLVSDSLIALQAFTSWYAVPEHGFWVMLTYVVGQVLIASGVVAQARRRAPVEILST
ncbi:lysoplasmalogenase [Cellulomonas sp. P24]|uniref:lysoplasmalogenase n=1 Tax=Cellulomonas sp. P24 TaxID=2885206 RepID=UPI00216B6410|nr:lysoplasmalogenase [Cellulomonas sp. P24]MCR6494300.1 lysoplasmalogenase [Cellulomonas sp. P24]